MVFPILSIMDLNSILLISNTLPKTNLLYLDLKLDMYLNFLSRTKLILFSLHPTQNLIKLEHISLIQFQDHFSMCHNLDLPNKLLIQTFAQGTKEHFVDQFQDLIAQLLKRKYCMLLKQFLKESTNLFAYYVLINERIPNYHLLHNNCN